MRACHSRSAEAISSMIGCEEPDTVSSPDVRVGRGGKGLLNWDSVGEAERMEAGYTGRRARVESAWSGGGVSLNDLRVAASFISSSSSRTGSISLIVLFQLANTSSDVRPSGELLSALKSSVRRPSASETSSRTNMWDAGKMPMKTCCSSSARADGLGFEVDGSEDSDQLTCGRREVQTTYLHTVSNYG